MQKLIDADKLKEHYAWWDNEDKKIFDTIVDLQSEAVVRCKDCFICETRQTANYLPFLYCELHDCNVLENFYCSWGERKEDGNKPKSI